MALNFGIEYELEEVGHDIPPRGWRIEPDGTLRNRGAEFVTMGKNSLQRSKGLVQNLFSDLADQYTISHRCSTHIHVDTTGLNGYRRVALLLGLIAHDEWFFSFGENRKANNFCCPTLYSPMSLCAINKAVLALRWDHERETMTRRRDIDNLTDDDLKYMSINTMTLRNLGTIELRHFPPLSPCIMEGVLDKIASIYAHAETLSSRSSWSSVLNHWDGFDPELEDEIKWVSNMYMMHRDMTSRQVSSRTEDQFVNLEISSSLNDLATAIRRDNMLGSYVNTMVREEGEE